MAEIPSGPEEVREEIGDKGILAFDKGEVEGLKHRQKKLLSKLALEIGMETSTSLWVKLGITSFFLSLLRRDQKDLLEVEDRRLKKATFKECW